LIPIGFSMWLAHFSNHVVAHQLPSLDLAFLDIGLLFTLYSAWRVACRIGGGGSASLAVMSPWALLASGLYSAGVWIVFQPMQMRGAM
jgi:hypothetical protein